MQATAADSTTQCSSQTSLSEFAFAADDENPKPCGFIPVQALAKALEPLGFAPSRINDARRLGKQHFLDPANEKIVLKLHTLTWEQNFAGFEYTVPLDEEARARLGTRFPTLTFSGNFIDRGEFHVFCTNAEEDFKQAPRSNALVSLLYNQRFRGVEAFAAACHNALGEDVRSVPLEGRVFAKWHSKALATEVMCSRVFG